MRRLYYIAATLFVSIAALPAMAQTITPYNLIQFFRQYIVNDNVHLLNASDYLRTFDVNWYFEDRLTQHESTMDIHRWLYRGEDPNLHRHSLSGGTFTNAGSGKVTHMVSYEFVEPELYQRYVQQVAAMNPVDGGPSRSPGGAGRIFHVNGLSFILTTYPAGIKAEQPIYAVELAD